MTTREDILGFLCQDERYIQLSKLGEGGMGLVNLVFDHNLQRIVARKSLLASRIDDLQLLQSFTNEIKLLGSLDHPGILSLYDANLESTREPCYSMSYVEGEDLHNWIRNMQDKNSDVSSIPLEKTLRIIEKLAETLAYAHDRGVVHLDLKPANIRIGQYGELVIMDWGTARVFDESKFREQMSRFGDCTQFLDPITEDDELLIGTPRYMSPEQMEGKREDLTPASDIFSVGVIFYQLLTGRYPFPAHTLLELNRMIQEFEPDPPHRVNPNVPIRISRICMKMLHKSLNKRYTDFKTIIPDLAEFRDSGARFPSRVYEAGEVIFREGDPGDYTCHVITGCVGISVKVGNAYRTIARLQSNEPFGELSLLTDKPRNATATALEKSTIRIISYKDLSDELEKMSPWVGSVIGALSHRFAEQGKHIRELEEQVDQLKNNTEVFPD